jgi:hypothetical protein
VSNSYCFGVSMADDIPRPAENPASAQDAHDGTNRQLAAVLDWFASRRQAFLMLRRKKPR